MAQIIQDIPEKPALLLVLKQRDCSILSLVQVADTYTDLFNVLEDNIEGLNCIPEQLKAILDVFPDQVLLDYRIFYKKSGVITDPQIVVAGVHTDIIIENPVPTTDKVPAIYITAGTIADRLIIRNNTFVGYLLISGGSKINTLVVEEGSKVRRVYLNTCDLFPSQLVTLDCKGVEGVEYFTVEPQPEVPATTTVLVAS